MQLQQVQMAAAAAVVATTASVCTRQHLEQGISKVASSYSTWVLRLDLTLPLPLLLLLLHNGVLAKRSAEGLTLSASKIIAASVGSAMKHDRLKNVMRRGVGEQDRANSRTQQLNQSLKTSHMIQ
jgi:hypothetical protein